MGRLVWLAVVALLAFPVVALGEQPPAPAPALTISKAQPKKDYAQAPCEDAACEFETLLLGAGVPALVGVTEVSVDGEACSWPFPCEPANEPLAHLEKAVEHLEAGGMPEVAAELREHIVKETRSIHQRELNEKLAELEKLQAEVNRLRHLTGTAEQVLVNIKVYEVSLAKMRALGVDFESFGLDGWDRRHGLDAISNKGLSAFLDALRERGIAKVLAEPALVMTVGRPCSFHAGSDIPIAVQVHDDQHRAEMKRSGTSVDVLSRSAGEGKIALELRVRVANEDESRFVDVNGERVVGLQVREIDTGIVSQLGETTVLNGLVRQNRAEKVVDKDGNTQTVNRDEETLLVLLITPESIGVERLPVASKPENRAAPVPDGLPR